MAVWVIATLCPATVKLPLRLCVPAFTLTVQGAALPETEIEAQLTLDVADAAGQSLGTAVIVILPEAPVGGALMVAVLNPYEHTAPDCETPAVLPPMVKLPLRASQLGFALTDQDAVPPGTDTEAQLTPELAVAAGQSSGLGVTVMLPAPPAGPTLTLPGFRV